MKIVFLNFSTFAHTLLLYRYCSSDITAIKKIVELWTTSSLNVREKGEQMRGALSLLPEAHALTLKPE